MDKFKLYNGLFIIESFKKAKNASKCIKKILAELECPRELEFQIIHSVCFSECTEDGGTWDEVSKLIEPFLENLDTQEGYMIYDSADYMWDFLDWDGEEISTSDANEVFVDKNEGLVVIYNKYALCEDQYPIIVIKRSFWNAKGTEILETLKSVDIQSDYTSKISPGVYFEIFFAEK